MAALPNLPATYVAARTLHYSTALPTSTTSDVAKAKQNAWPVRCTFAAPPPTAYPSAPVSAARILSPVGQVQFRA